ncbi:ribosome biogenesis GTPase YlqF [Spiroplasma endosymbiont of Crioceris asparagi]|uniref:ribosome biogenesis GTPase YlqF n=1 Tax=Spiroplasma endosymbiont of Crioceris asparagi TaxID=3066286 RepID=UPI0030CF6312
MEIISDKKSFNWFPGHMNKTLKKVEQMLKWVDLIIEVVDARAPYSTQNPMIKKIIKQSDKNKLMIFTKNDLADESVTRKWISVFEKQGNKCFVIKDHKKPITKEFIKLIEKLTAKSRKKQEKRGIDNPEINVMILGIPNVGKSTVISRVVKNKKIKIANMPGITKGLQRFVLTDSINLYDTPGVLPSKFESELVAFNCAAVNAININVVPKERLAARMMRYIYEVYPNVIENRYDIKKQLPRPISYEDAFKLFEEIAKRKNMFVFNDMPNVNKAIDLFINDLINNKLQKISYESPLNIGEPTAIEETLINDGEEIDPNSTSDFENGIEW